MKSKLNYLIGISLKRKIKTKWFVIANVLLALVIIGIINIDSIITFFGGDFNTIQTVYVIDNTNKTTDIFKEQVKQITETLYGEDSEKYFIKEYEDTEENAQNLLKENKKEQGNIVIVFSRSEENVIDVKMITFEYMDLTDTQILNSAINNTKTSIALQETNIPMDEINKIYAPATIERIYLDEKKNSEEENMEIITTTVFPIIILPFFMLTLFLVQMIGAEVNDEKTTKAMEVIISNVSPKIHFFAKVIAGNLFVFMQGILLFIFAGVGFGVRKMVGGSSIANGLGAEVGKIVSGIMESNVGQNLLYIIPLTLLLMVLTFIAYSLLAGILASMTTNIEDFQQLQTPIIVISLIGYYLAMMAGVFKGALFIKILSFVPLISAILAPSLLILGQIGILEIVIAIFITIGFNYLLIKYGLRIYKVGILNYSSSDLWKKMFKALQNK